MKPEMDTLELNDPGFACGVYAMLMVPNEDKNCAMLWSSCLALQTRAALRLILDYHVSLLLI